MARVLVIGAGSVGSRAARQLAETPGVELCIADAHVSRASGVAAALGAQVVDAAAGWPEDLTGVAVAVDAGSDVGLVERAVEAGLPVTTAGDDHEAIRGLLRLGTQPLETPVVAGAGLAPGLSDVLAHHGAATFDEVTEVHVARYGAAGPACRSEVRRAHRDHAVEWRDGTWQVARARGPELVWFPDPVGARECESVAGGIALVVAAFGELGLATFRLGEPASRRRTLMRRGADDWGAIRVEVWGRRGDMREPVVYGAIDRTAFATGAVLAVTAAGLAGLLPEVLDPRPGVHGLGPVAHAPAFLSELARRGVKAAAFEGVPVG